LIDCDPSLRPVLFKAQRALKAWTRLVPPVSYPPLTWELTLVLATKMAHSHWASGVAVLLAFVCYLRIGELVSLEVGDVAMAGDPRVSSKLPRIALRLRKTKRGPNQWVVVHDARVEKLISLLLNRPASASLFGLSASQFRRFFKVALADLGLSPFYVPHSLRHGGATHDYVLGLTLEESMERGRWVSTKSARRYVQMGRSLLLSLEVPAWLPAVAKTLDSNVFETFGYLLRKACFASAGAQ
jgi:integrase